MKQLVHFLCFVTAPYAVLNIYLTTHTLKGTRAGLVTSRDLQGIRLWKDQVIFSKRLKLSLQS
jgi:hypothetical protein